jgi:pyruvate formate lyase activating enzyme
MNWTDKLYDFDALQEPHWEPKGLVFDVQRFAIHDGGGIRTNVFLKGCPLNCLWCQNPESIRWRQDISFVEQHCIQCGKCIEVCPVSAIKTDPSEGQVTGIDTEKCILCGACFKTCYAGAINIIGRWLSVEDLVAMVNRDRDFYVASGGGITFSGGEPTGQPKFLLAALQAMQGLGLHTAVETCLHVPWEQLEPLLSHVDLLLTDIKHMDPERHGALTGVSNELILENFRNIAGLGIPVRVRIPLITGLNDDVANLQATADLIASCKNVQGVDVLPYNRLGISKCHQLGCDYALADVAPPSTESVEATADLFRSVADDVTVGGM